MKRVTAFSPLWLFVFAAFAPISAAFATTNEIDTGTLVDSNWLTAHVSDAAVRVLDVRSPQEYEQGHIPGAVNLPVESLFVHDNELRYIAPLAQIQQILKKAGVSNDTRVVVYDTGKFVPATRAFWVLEVYGHKSVTVLDGGFGGWVKAGNAVSMEPVTPKPGSFVPSVTPERLATKLLTRLALNRTDTVIIDARPKPEFQGQKSRASRYGHIPTAVSFPGFEHFNTEGDIRYLKSDQELRALFDYIEPNKKVITYCNNGLLSASVYYVLRRLGYNVSNYDGSWIEWGNDVALPIEIPKKSTSGPG